MRPSAGGAFSQKSGSSSTKASQLLMAWGFPLIVGFAGAYLAQRVRVSVQLPGHTGIALMAAILIGRLGSRNQLGGLAGGLGALMAGAMIDHDPIKSIGLVVAGGVIDLFLGLARRWKAEWLWYTLAGGVGHTAVLLLKLLAGDLPKAVLTRGLSYGFMTYIGFGLAGGLLAGLVAQATAQTRRA